METENVELKYKYNITHRIIRYEDFSLDIWNQSLELLQFTRREMTSEVKTFLHHHTTKTNFEGKITYLYLSKELFHFHNFID